MGAHTTSDDPTRYRLNNELESWKLKDPIERVKAHLSRTGMADQAFFDALEAEADELAAHVRKGCLEMPDPEPLSMFDHVYAEEHPLLVEEREQFAAYLDTFEESDRRPLGAPDDADHARQGRQHGAAQGDGGRPEGPRHGRGRRQARRRLPRHRRSAEGLRRGPRHRHPARRVRHHRHRHRAGAARLPPGLRDPVRRVRLPRVRPDRQPAGQDARPRAGQGVAAGRRADPGRRRHRRGRAPQRVQRGLLRAHRRTQGGRLLQPGRRLLHGAAGDRDRRPGHLLRAEAALLGEGRPRRVD